MAKRKVPQVYVLILNWNGKALTIDCVRSVLKSDYANYRVLVIDNGSHDGSADELRRRFGSTIEVIENERNLGYACGFNVGLRYAFVDKRSDYCLVMNNDTVIDPAAISELVKIGESNDSIGFVTGKVYFYDRPNVLQTVGKEDDPILWNGAHIGGGDDDKGQYDGVCERAFTDDIFTLVRRQLYNDTGGYDTTFFLQSEEYDWQARAKELGYKIVYTPHAKLWHKDSMTIGKDSSLKAYYDARNPMLVVLLHRSPAFFRRYLWFHFRKNILRSSLTYTKQGRVTHALAKWRGLVAGLLWGFKIGRLTPRHFI